MPDTKRARERMVDVHLARRGIRDRRVLDAMRAVPREAFVEEGFEEFAYEDGPLPIAESRRSPAGFVSRSDSYERACHETGEPRFLLDLRRDEVVRRRLAEPRLERFIGVIYRPDTELMSHYAEACLSRQFDAYVWFDETNAVSPLWPGHERQGVPDTYPFGL
jgi:hypothetical protein